MRTRLTTVLAVTSCCLIGAFAPGMARADGGAGSSCSSADAVFAASTAGGCAGIQADIAAEKANLAKLLIDLQNAKNGIGSGGGAVVAAGLIVTGDVSALKLAYLNIAGQRLVVAAACPQGVPKSQNCLDEKAALTALIGLIAPLRSALVADRLLLATARANVVGGHGDKNAIEAQIHLARNHLIELAAELAHCLKCEALFARLDAAIAETPTLQANLTAAQTALAAAQAAFDAYDPTHSAAAAREQNAIAEYILLDGIAKSKCVEGRTDADGCPAAKTALAIALTERTNAINAEQAADDIWGPLYLTLQDKLRDEEQARFLLSNNTLTIADLSQQIDDNDC